MAHEDGAGNPFWDPLGLLGGRSGTPGGPWGLTSRHTGMAAGTTPLRWLLEVARSRLVGRRVRWEVNGAPVAFDVEDIIVAGDSMLLGAGQVDELAVVATSVVWGSHVFPAGRLTFHNVHTRPGLNPALVSAPIDLRLSLDAAEVAHGLAQRVRWLRVDITDRGELRARPRKPAGFGWVTCSLLPAGDAVGVELRTLTLAGRSWALPSALRPIRIPLALPSDARLIEVRALSGSLEICIRLDERRVDIKTLTSFLSRGQNPPDDG